MASALDSMLSSPKVKVKVKELIGDECWSIGTHKVLIMLHQSQHIVPECDCEHVNSTQATFTFTSSTLGFQAVCHSCVPDVAGSLNR